MDDSLVRWLLNRPPLQAWTGDDKIPWNDPEFSQRMLCVHLDQSTGLASRPFQKIDSHVQFIHQEILQAKPSRVLDLGCGPGFYVHRLTSLGHEVSGIDFSPASIEYAKSHGGGSFVLKDLLAADYGKEWDLITFMFGEPNTFAPNDLRKILMKSYSALNPMGRLLMEVTTPQTVRAMGSQGPAWAASQGGLFHPKPHLWLQESCWDDAVQAAKTRWIVMLEEGEPFTFASATQSWNEDQMHQLLAELGFQSVRTYPSMMGIPDPDCPEFLAWLAIKPSGDGVN